MDEVAVSARSDGEIGLVNLGGGLFNVSELLFADFLPAVPELKDVHRVYHVADNAVACSAGVQVI